MKPDITASQLAERYNMDAHVEGGSFTEIEHRREDARQASGSMYYFLPQGQYAKFHQLDCDEYWAYIAGDALELFVINETGNLTIELLGITENASPLVKIGKGCIFAARHTKEIEDGTFLSCITVPQFTYKGWRLVSREEVLGISAEAAVFWETTA